MTPVPRAKPRVPSGGSGVPPPARPVVPPPADEFRTWTSADGKFCVEAKMLDSENGNVRLQRRNGQIVTVPLSKLNPADNDYVRENEK